MGLSREFKRRRLLGWAVLSSVFILVNFHRVSTGVLTGSLASAFDTTGAELGLLHASFFYIYAPMQLVAGVLVDQRGTRRVTVLGSVVMAVGAVAFASSDSYLLGLLSRALVGFGGSVVYIGILRYCANWFRANEFATMTGVTLSASALGGLVATTPLALAVGAYGWRDTYLFLGAVGLVTTLGVLVFVRDSPDDAGYEPVSSSVAAPDLTVRQVVGNAKTVFAERTTWVLGVMMFFAVGTNYTVMGLWGVPYMVHAYDLSVATASLFPLAGNLGLLFGSTGVGWISDRLGRRTSITVVTATVYTGLFAGISLLGTPPLVYVAVAFFGVMFLHGGFLLSFTIIKERHSGATSGTATGAINGMGFFGAAVIPGVMGVALDAFWTGETVAGSRIYTLVGYRVAFGIAALSGLIGLCCALWLRRSSR
ncbi:MFS transporter [Haloarchaeobius litoreus]|uniref:Lysosomal dipeptide transporter MFSD1 n=1 Tax=Haloarchaeobius litoreus TaxID=755306 RepID=A0ABD6DRF6_9EURY|nr:MFS transporter [Haloarchaeobius litoreus]